MKVFRTSCKVVIMGCLYMATLVSVQANITLIKEEITHHASQDTLLQTQLDEVSVTATKIGLPFRLASKQVTILTKKDIEQAPVKSTQDLLNYVAGVDVLQRSPHGVQADISLQGGSADQVAILLNGVNLTNPQTGHYSFDIPINISDIERIEIVQGPASLAYGANAFSGGINIITRKDTASNIMGKIEGGMHTLFGTEIRGVYKNENVLHKLSAGYNTSGGYIANSDYDILNLLLESTLSVADKAKIDFQAGYNDKKYGANTFYTAAYPNQYEDTKSIFASASAETSGKVKFISQMYLNTHFDCFHLIREGTPDVPLWYKNHNYHRSDLFGINLSGQHVYKRGITLFGGEIRTENILSNVLGIPLNKPIGRYKKHDSRTNISYFIEHNIILSKFTLSLGGSLNQNTAFVNKVWLLPAINASFRPVSAISIYASWDKSMRMPSFTELYYSTPTHTGNSELLPEYASSVKAGLRAGNKIVSLSGSAYYTHGENLIDWIYNDTDDKWYSTNLAVNSKLQTLGVGGEVTIKLDEIFINKQPFKHLKVGYHYIDQENRGASSNNPISKYVFNYLKHKFTATLSHGIVKNMSATWNFRFQDRNGSYIKYINLKPGYSVDYKPVALLDCKINYRLNNLELYINANNIFNSVHVDFGNIPQPGFWLIAGVSYSLQ